MSETLAGRVSARVVSLPAGALAWQRTAVTGTELVFAAGASASGTAVVTGCRPYIVQWRAELGVDGGPRKLDVVCRDEDQSRDLSLDADPAAVVRLADSPIFVTWAVRRLGLTVGGGVVRVPSVRILTPSLEVVTGMASYHLVSPHRLRVTGDGPAATYELDGAGLVTYQPGNLRLVR